MKLEWEVTDDYAFCRTPHGKMFAYYSELFRHWYVPMSSTDHHDGILPAKMTLKQHATRDSVIKAMEDWYTSTRKEQPNA